MKRKPTLLIPAPPQPVQHYECCGKSFVVCAHCNKTFFVDIYPIESGIPVLER